MKSILKSFFFLTKSKIPQKYELEDNKPKQKIVGLDKSFVLSFLNAKYKEDTSDDLLFDVIDDISKSALEPIDTINIKLNSINTKLQFSYSSVDKTTFLYQKLLKEKHFLITLKKEFEGAF